MMFSFDFDVFLIVSVCPFGRNVTPKWVQKLQWRATWGHIGWRNLQTRSVGYLGCLLGRQVKNLPNICASSLGNIGNV